MTIQDRDHSSVLFLVACGCFYFNIAFSHLRLLRTVTCTLKSKHSIENKLQFTDTAGYKYM